MTGLSHSKSIHETIITHKDGRQQPGEQSEELQVVLPHLEKEGLNEKELPREVEKGPQEVEDQHKNQGNLEFEVHNRRIVTTL